MGRKPAASAALRYLVAKGIRVECVVAPTPDEVSDATLFWRPLLRDTAAELGIPVVPDRLVYEWFENPLSRARLPFDLSNLDVVISFLFWKRIREPLISTPRIGCFNFHPAPLPEFRGRRGYNFAILEGYREYGASLHWVSQRFDEGKLVEVRYIPIEAHETALSLERKTMKLLLQMHQDFADLLLGDAPIPSTPQGPGKSATKAQMLEETHVRPTDPPDLIERRVRAFWYPPHTGATITIAGKTFTLVDEETLRRLGPYLHDGRDCGSKHSSG